MKYNELNLKKYQTVKRAGRGIAAGRGKTAGRGTKGQKSRSGYSRRGGFEGGQTPLIQKLPKLRGFKSHKSAPETVNINDLAKLKVSAVDNKLLADYGYVSSQYVNVKLIGIGEVPTKMHVKLQKASSGAVKSLEKSGGSFTSVKQLSRPKQLNKKATLDRQITPKDAV